ncbi:bifunctional 3-(3-hydroxy-phenyl)propionate/3-hydroxycinnamic acid hydroxylase [Acinetobacter gerneri]|uniref:Bifunctional 3-(3-hydroxy-phenyl)propionate/3-hydroxycinnamic acid hydroxylase n=1 Tax=Acinetobacter gerneri TaxID=202952 RepID=A0AAW8JG50_9GAMM|nr:bifunctional 3-(3-hydroxy-phenyl)propionate/3-hydroxycinnamic acid hydroxylase [Acinetobacter gerneri]MDQ9009679.1 bifunctional 3-(3-hydroxy-phenyl)propionate/3-hydroxycinnamic acid hydroxylase [Acinetobacter gerneri]MDQ9013651.1 bifunctional 3-(3-hydroxy-phenyl)propionate/3-hydroxycinnamic acid hydroxylase [Acinetobacter gerneri]MDQ9025065.1 bifunctional 3-(3-hydroxy-phenyl)propionate/3-hydroxycinnamic acid hydroxylase [Acinetobacter gerneri]MDQ9050828.1 bifunctional 3-(3-hydroxy-phenyl)pro
MIDFTTDVAILGAGPVGLTLANYLSKQGIKVTVVEQLDHLIDYPRAIGIDDESLRTIQSLGLVEQVLPHTTPNHAMRFLTPKGRCFADIQPMTREFGWSRRNAFIQPQVDNVLLQGLKQYPDTQVLFARHLKEFSQDQHGVSLSIENKEQQQETVHAKYLIACDGGNSIVRRTLNIGFEGKTSPNQWIVIDIDNDPLATPHIYLCCDPVRPYVSAALPHGIRRFEFMVMPGETQEELSKPENISKLLSKVLPNTENVDVIRQRVYTHNARIADKFRVDRILLAGDAAHIMPVWQGQGYNSGMRDAFNLGWKMALVVKGVAGPELLDSYQIERKDHAKAMIDLSVMAGNVLAPPKKWHGFVRDSISYVLNYIKPIKQYLLEMRFKPMPKYNDGALLVDQNKNSPVGKMFIQPQVKLENGETVLLDDVIGNDFAIIAWGVDPKWGLTQDNIQKWQKLGVKFIQVLPAVQLGNENRKQFEGVITIGDIGTELRSWFGNTDQSMVVLRPDRFVAALAIPQSMNAVSTALFAKLHA